jgi:hypothetical protein
MEAKELRIGNVIFSKETQEIQKIVGITLENPFIDAITFDYTNYDEIEPVPLTEDWLLKAGFDHREFSFDKGSFYLMKRTGKSEYLYQAHTNRFQVKYVHQLQNLYFAVTENELFD